MKRILALLFTLLAMPASADEIVGFWAIGPTEQGERAVIEVAPCADADGFCGRIVETAGFDAADLAVVRAPGWPVVLSNMRAEGAGRYGGGEVAIPRLDRTVAGELRLEGDLMRLEACFSHYCKRAELVRVTGPAL